MSFCLKWYFSGWVTDKATSDFFIYILHQRRNVRKGEMYVKLPVFKYHSLVKISGFFPYNILSSLLTSFFTIFLTDFQSALFDIIYISFSALNLFFPTPSENLNLVFVIICITETAMGPRWNQNSILLAQIHAEKQYLLWRLDNSGIQTWTPQRDVHFKHVVKQLKKYLATSHRQWELPWAQDQCPQGWDRDPIAEIFKMWLDGLLDNMGSLCHEMLDQMIFQGPLTWAVHSLL